MVTALVRPAALSRDDGLGLCSDTARWVLTLLAWVWLGEQGIQSGWLYASGVWPLVLWWGSRLAARHVPWRVDAPVQAVVICSSAAAAAMSLMAYSVSPNGLSFFMLLIGAVCWGVCTGVSEHAQQCSRTPPHAAAPLIAALVVVALWWVPPFWASSLVVLVILVGATVMAAHALRTVYVIPPTGQDGCLAPLAMGLMMGTMWQSSAWCVGLGWSETSGLVAHVLLMAALPAVAMRLDTVITLQVQTRQVLTLTMLAVGALLLAFAGATYWVWGMILHALAWALQYVKVVAALPKASAHTTQLPRTSQAMVLTVGPVVLWLIGETIQHHGPVVLQLVQVWLCCACTVALYRLARQHHSRGVRTDQLTDQ